MYQYIMKRNAELLSLASRYDISIHVPTMSLTHVRCISALVKDEDIRGNSFKRMTEFYSVIILELNRGAGSGNTEEHVIIRCRSDCNLTCTGGRY